MLVAITPGPGTATVLRVAAGDGRAAAGRTILGNSVGVLTWGALSAVGVSSLIVASQVAYDVLRIDGAAALVILGARSLLARHRADGEHAPETGGAERTRRQSGFRAGLVTACSTEAGGVLRRLVPAVPDARQPMLPCAAAMATAVVALDIAWYSALAYAVDMARDLFRPRVQGKMERVTGAVMIGLGIRLAMESR